MSSTYAPPAADSDLNGIAVAASVGDDDAMAELMALIRPMVLGFCKSRLRGSRCPSAEDVTQEVCIAVMSALPRYENRDRFTSFVFGIASHKIVDALRAMRRDKSVPVDTVPDIAPVADTPEDSAIRADTLHQVEELLEVLSPRQRTILRLRIVEERTVAETASELGTTAAAVRVAQHRALNRLRGRFTA